MRLFPLVLASFFGILSASGLEPLITEFLASNSSGLRDEDGSYSDWVEIHNPGAAAIHLGGWHLTDNAANLTKWQFPPVQIPGRGYLVVFASGKDRRLSEAPLHANFSLSAAGEYLGLVKPDGVTVTSQYAPTFPAQTADISFGLPTAGEQALLVQQSAACRWVVPSSSSIPGAGWRAVGFNDAGWNSATLGIGYDRTTAGVNFLPEIGAGGNTESSMYNLQGTCYVRIPFTLRAGTELASLKLRLKYEDGFAAWINGVPLLSNGIHLRRNTPEPLAWDSIATAENLDANAVVFEDFDVSDSIRNLADGENVLSFQVLNRSLNSSDLLLRPELSGLVITGTAETLPAAYFAGPTPGQPNSGTAGTILPQTVTFSHPEGSYGANFNLVLGGAQPGQQIRYTLDGSLPGPSSLLYSAPLSITGSQTVRARILDPESGAGGFVVTRLYERMASSALSYGSTGQPFRSSLPVLVINNRGAGEPSNNDQFTEARIHVFDRDASGYSSLASAPVASMNAGLKIRGSSSSGFTKKSYGVELRNETGEGIAMPLLDLPAGEDWALISCHQFDPAFMRNAWVYEASRQSGRWAPRTRLVEVFFNFNGNNLSYTQSDYRGVYLLCENIRRGGDRVDVTKLETSDTSAPGVTGGFIFKVDRPDSDEFRWKTSRNMPVGEPLVIHRPKLPDLAVQQSAYLVNYFQAFENALHADAAGSFATRNYLNFIEPVSWADHNLFNAFAKNVDALRLSAFYQKDRGRKMEGGPLWDFDRSADSTDSRDNDFNSWRGTGDSTDYFTYSWWNQLFADVEFRQIFIDRWQLNRRGALATANIQAILDGFLAEFKSGDADHPARRDYAKWYGFATAKNIVNETNHLKNWLTNRAAWMDSQFAASPQPSHPGGMVAAGQTVSLQVPVGTTVYYTLDGTDPRALGGSLGASAITYGGGLITVPQTALLTARARRAGTNYVVPATAWSGPSSTLFLIDESYADAGSLRVSGIHYNPLAPDAAELAKLPDLDASDFEWLELLNTSAQAINLEGVSLVKGSPVSALTLPPFSLQPGERAVIVKNRAAFQLRHPFSGDRIVAEWSGDKRLDNGGEEIWLLAAQGGTIARFDYDDGAGWPQLADGAGSALEYQGEGGATADYQNSGHWQASLTVHGTPGYSGSEPLPGIVINEVLASSRLPQLDGIELYNRSQSPVEIGGWFLSNAASPLTVEDLQKFRIPGGIVLEPGEHRVFTEADFNPEGSWNSSPGPVLDEHFSLDGYRGGRVWLVSAEPASGSLHRIEDMVDFSPGIDGVSQGRWPDGGDGFGPLASSTLFNEASSAVPLPGLGGANATPRAGVVQVSEIMYHPESGGWEFIEIVNTGTSSESLQGWTLRGDVDFYFNPGHSLAGGESLVLLPFDPDALPATAAAFRARYGVPASTILLGPWNVGKTLGNKSGTVRLRRAVPPPPEAPALLGLMIEDDVRYFSTPPWPTTASGTGQSIRRLGIHQWGANPQAWLAGDPAPGRDSGGYAGWQREYFNDGDVLAGPLDDFDGDGIPNQLEYLLGTDPRLQSEPPFTSGIAVEGAVPRLFLDYSRRLDRDDFLLGAWRSFDLENWFAVEDDVRTGAEGLFEFRRASLPIEEGAGFLRLQAE